MVYVSPASTGNLVIDLTIVPDDNMSVQLDGDNQQVIRLVASAIPRIQAY